MQLESNEDAGSGTEPIVTELTTLPTGTEGIITEQTTEADTVITEDDGITETELTASPNEVNTENNARYWKSGRPHQLLLLSLCHPKCKLTS